MPVVWWQPPAVTAVIFAHAQGLARFCEVSSRRSRGTSHQRGENSGCVVAVADECRMKFHCMRSAVNRTGGGGERAQLAEYLAGCSSSPSLNSHCTLTSASTWATYTRRPAGPVPHRVAASPGQNGGGGQRSGGQRCGNYSPEPTSSCQRTARTSSMMVCCSLSRVRLGIGAPSRIGISRRVYPIERKYPPGEAGTRARNQLFLSRLAGC